MKLLLALVVLCVIAGSLYADYRWKRWMAQQREQRERDDGEFRG
jgi:hypothetical protein